VKEVFTPATDKEIEDYREKHEQWLKQCGDRLRDLYRTLQARHGPPVFVFSASNYGARPANNALVTFRAMGQLEIMPPPYRSRDHDDEESDKREEEAPALSNPPSVPRGSWATVLAPRLGTFDALQKIHSGFGLATASTVMSENLLRGLSPPEPDDPNGFYYKPNRPRFPSEQFSLECQQWRHGIEPHQFVGQIQFDEVAASISGAIECRIHAENLSQSAAKTVPVRIRVRRVNTLEIAEEMVRRLSP
jgi:hypothetical protein